MLNIITLTLGPSPIKGEGDMEERNPGVIRVMLNSLQFTVHSSQFPTNSIEGSGGNKKRVLSLSF